MENKAEICFEEIEENKEYIDIIQKVVYKLFQIENMLETNIYLNVILTNPTIIKKTNRKYRNIDKQTDVLSFPMFEREELKNIIHNRTSIPYVLGDIMISVERVKEQAKEYGHSFEREFSYMIVHGFYHLLGYDHLEEKDKKQMREKEERVLNELKVWR